MSAPAFTPGPWEYETHELSEGVSCIVYGANGICVADHLDEPTACLIAAAPDLLAAAETVLAGLNERIDAATDSVPVFAGIAALSDAINKARVGAAQEEAA